MTDESERSKTKYVVLRENEYSGWTLISSTPIEAWSADQALTIVGEALTREGGDALPEQDRFVAVAARSWRPRHLSLNIQTRIEVGP